MISSPVYKSVAIDEKAGVWVGEFKKLSKYIGLQKRNGSPSVPMKGCSLLPNPSSSPSL